MALYGGIDSGSSTTEMVILTEEGEIACYQRTLTSGDVTAAGEKVLAGCLEQLGVGRGRADRNRRNRLRPQADRIRRPGGHRDHLLR